MLLRFLSPHHPLWLAAFRPFFLLAIIMGVLLPGLWGFVFSGSMTLSVGVSPLQWHAHEMLYGFGGAVLFGFLLTASKNWVNVRGIHGLGLMLLTGLWIFERIFFYFAFALHPVIKHVSLSLFILFSGFYIATTLIKYRKNDSSKDNFFFIILLGLIILAKNFLISESYYQHGAALTLGLFRLAFALMFERTMTQFMKVTEGLNLYRNSLLDYSIKFLVLLSVFQSFLPHWLTLITLVSAASLLLLRWLIWRPDIGLQKFGNATMYLGYLGLVLHLFFEAMKAGEIWSEGTISTHLFTFLCMGLVIPCMFVRIAQGHTGRKPEFFTSDKIAISLIILASIFRLLLTVIVPGFYSNWIMWAGLLLYAFSAAH
jgi:uncharacterized protein involved in response to NO